jgi:hypothetical protein
VLACFDALCCPVYILKEVPLIGGWTRWIFYDPIVELRGYLERAPNDIEMIIGLFTIDIHKDTQPVRDFLLITKTFQTRDVFWIAIANPRLMFNLASFAAQQQQTYCVYARV